MKIIQIAEELWGELSEDDSISPTLISFYLTENIGNFNNLTSASLTINPDNSEILPDPSEDEKSILKQLYIIHFNDKKLRAVLSGADANSIVEISEAGGTIRMLNKNELAKSYIAIKKEEQNRLKDLIHGYRMNRSEATQIAGKDVVEGVYPG